MARPDLSMTCWEPETYLQLEEYRTRPAAELLARIPSQSPQIVYDLGCGPANSTRLLQTRWPSAQLVGVDKSPEMLARAQATDITAQWVEADINSWKPAYQPDLIFSNATLQWLPDHAALFHRLMNYVKPGGAFGVQMPRNFTSPSHTIIQQIVEAGPWAGRLLPIRDFNPVARPEDYFDYLSPISSTIDIWETEYVHVLSGENAVFRWLSGTAITPYLSVLEDTERDNFIEQCKQQLSAVYRPRENGTTLFPFRRLFIVASSRT
jgi:trans-aconitate 2-methyltransferase